MLSEVANKQKTISDWSVKRRYQNQNLRFISDDKNLNSDGESGNIFFNKLADGIKLVFHTSLS